MMKFAQTIFLVAVCATTTTAVEDEKLPLRRLRQQTLHIPDLFEMSAETKEKNEWYDAKDVSSSSHASGNSAQHLTELDVFARLLQSDSSLSLSMPTAPPPVVVPTPMVVPSPTVVTPPTSPLPAPTTLPPPTPPAPIPTSCPVYPVCASLGLIGECCPTTEGVFLDCCYGIVPAPNSSPVIMAPSIPGTIEPAPTPVVVGIPTPGVDVPSPGVVAPTSKTKQGMDMAPSGGMSSVESPVSSMSGSMSSSSGGMSSVESPVSSMSSSMSSSSGGMSSVESPVSSMGSSMSSSSGGMSA